MLDDGKVLFLGQLGHHIFLVIQMFIALEMGKEALFTNTIGKGVFFVWYF